MRVGHVHRLRYKKRVKMGVVKGPPFLMMGGWSSFCMVALYDADTHTCETWAVLDRRNVSSHIKLILHYTLHTRHSGILPDNVFITNNVQGAVAFFQRCGIKVDLL